MLSSQLMNCIITTKEGSIKNDINFVLIALYCIRFSRANSLKINDIFLAKLTATIQLYETSSA